MSVETSIYRLPLHSFICLSTFPFSSFFLHFKNQSLFLFSPPHLPICDKASEEKQILFHQWHSTNSVAHEMTLSNANQIKGEKK